MEVLTMLKFWKSNSNTTSKVAAGTTASDSSETVVDSTVSNHFNEESDDDDDSYFELELTLPPHDSKFSKNEEKEEKKESDDSKMLFKSSNSKPQSPISIIRAAASPKLRVFMFGKLAGGGNKKSSKRSRRVEDFSETDSVTESYYLPNRLSNDSLMNSSSFTVKFKIEDGSIVPKFTRSRSSSSSTVSTSPKFENRNADVPRETSKRFSKDTVQKYLNLIRPKSSKKYSDSDKFGAASPTRSSTTPFSPLKDKEEKQSRFKVKCKQLGKSKSASAMIGVSSPANFPARNDLPADGIEGAILHCKRSLTSSTKGHSSLSRCSSDPSHEKSIPVSEHI